MATIGTMPLELVQQLRTLAAAARQACDAADSAELMGASDAGQYRVTAQEACEDFFELANEQLTEVQENELITCCEKATPQEQIGHTLEAMWIHLGRGKKYSLPAPDQPAGDE